MIGNRSPHRERLQSAFRKGVREGRRLEREERDITLAPAGFITPDAALMLGTGNGSHAVSPVREQEFTVPIYLGPAPVTTSPKGCADA